jgi:ribosomal protein RSM22 (predicted rRNA methylase)
MQIPAELRAALDACLEGVPRGELALRAERMSGLYREKAGSAVAVRDAADALAYAITRSPATYGAVRNVLGHLAERNSAFRPTTLLDLGSGAGAASWAVCDAWPGIKSIIQVDCNLPLQELNEKLARNAGCGALRAARRVTADVTRGLDAEPADLVMLSYMLAEMTEAQIQAVLGRAWESCTGEMVIVEPGTPVGYGKILAARRFVLENGGRILAPCPHEQACPLIAPDWCHFAQRVERSRDHRIVKGAELPYEDEKFSYVVGVREALFAGARSGRILARPEVDRAAITVKLCKVDGSAGRVSVPRRDKDEYRRAKRREWGNEL